MAEIVDFDESQYRKDSLFDCVHQNIDTVINKVVVYLGARANSPTVNGLKTLIAFELDGKKSAFYTDSKRLRMIATDPNRQYPFRSVIKVVRYGNYYIGIDFFAPTTPITQEDIENFNFYQRTKFKTWK